MGTKNASHSSYDASANSASQVDSIQLCPYDILPWEVIKMSLKDERSTYVFKIAEKVVQSTLHEHP